MIPAALVAVPAMPLTPNGKVDARALLAQEDNAAGRRESVAPRSPLEVSLVGIWRELLGIEKLGVEDDFFHAGGHSLLLTQLASRIQTEFGVEVPLRTLFENPRIDAMALAVAAARMDQQRGEAHLMLAEIERLSPQEVEAMLDADMDHG
jgi:hypothetical protein